MLNKNKIAVIGSGISGLSAAIELAHSGEQVSLFEKNADLGGRARKFEEDGFTFDMGPSWYWMPDVFEKFYNDYGYTTGDFYDLVQLDPGFKIIFGEDDEFSVPANYNELLDLFESIEPGAAKKLDLFMEEAIYKYNVGVKRLIHKPALSPMEFVDMELISGMFKLQVFKSFSKHVKKFFKHPKLIALMEFPVLFLGAMPEKTPALYSLMNYAGLKQGTFYPMGGFSKVIDALTTIAKDKGVEFRAGDAIDQIIVPKDRVEGISSVSGRHDFSGVIASADYHFVEQTLLPKSKRVYSKEYWDSRVFAPSCLLFYMGVNKKIPNLDHHNLYFDEDLKQHAIEIYETKKWPAKPLFYVCCPSKTDPSVAPDGQENIFMLMPIAAGIQDTPEMRAQYFESLMDRLEKHTKCNIRDAIVYKRSYCVSNFEEDYNAYKGNAYGLANTLMQTAFLKPKMMHQNVKNLVYAGQLTNPGPGVPPALISGQVAAKELLKHLNH